MPTAYKSAITAIDGNMNISDRETSNNYGLAFMYSGNLNVPISFKYDDTIEDVAYVYYRADAREQPTGLSFYGGFTDQAIKGFEKIFNAKKIVALKYDVFWTKNGEDRDIGWALNRRKDVPQHIKDKAAAIDWRSIETIKDTDYEFTKIAIGNSHTPAFTDYDSICVKTDGTTLNSQLSSDFSYVRSNIAAMAKTPTQVTMTFMDIDVRFHIVRLNADWKSMIDKWIDFSKELVSTYGCKVELAAPIPIETADRKHPKTGAYPKGSDIYFYGSVQERTTLVEQIKQYLKIATDHVDGVSVIQVPEQWYHMDKLEYEVTKMEKPRSVHIAPHSYRRNNWGIEEYKPEHDGYMLDFDQLWQ